MKVSFCIIAYNAELTLKNILNDLKSQDYPHEMIEVILVDGNSEDKTKEIMNDFKKEVSGFIRIEVKDNPKKTLPSGWNIALDVVEGDIILKVDAHASIPSDFISKNVSCIRSGEKICGGRRPNIIDEETPWKNTLLLAENSMFGSSIASYRRSTQKRYVKSLFHAAYSKEVFQKVGKFNESLTRTEDNEIHYRMRKLGYKFFYDPEIISFQHTRNSLRKMLKQKYSNGYWIGVTTFVCPKCLSIFYFIPMLFIIGIIMSTIFNIFGIYLLSILLWSSYISLSIVMAILSIYNQKFYFEYISLPILFFLLHASYGIGTIKGIVDTISKKLTISKC